MVKHYEPWQHQRHLVKPGLTGLWQVSARGTGLMHLHTGVDLDYVRTNGPITTSGSCSGRFPLSSGGAG